jgi:hypothetical protein
VLCLIELLNKYGSPLGTFLLSADNARFSEERAKYDSLMKILEFSIFSENLGLSAAYCIGVVRTLDCVAE